MAFIDCYGGSEEWMAAAEQTAAGAHGEKGPVEPFAAQRIGELKRKATRV